MSIMLTVGVWAGAGVSLWTLAIFGAQYSLCRENASPAIECWRAGRQAAQIYIIELAKTLGALAVCSGAVYAMSNLFG